MKKEVSFNSHQYVEQLEEAGFSSEQSYTVVGGQIAMLGRHTISKADFDAFGAENKAEHNELLQSIDSIGTKLDSIDAKLGLLNDSIGGKLDSVGTKLDSLQIRFIKWAVLPMYVLIAAQILTLLLK